MLGRQPHALNPGWGWGAPGPLLQLCRARAGGVGTESYSQPRLTKRIRFLGTLAAHPVDSSPGWTVPGEVGSTSLLFPSPEGPGSPAHGARFVVGMPVNGNAALVLCMGTAFNSPGCTCQDGGLL